MTNVPPTHWSTSRDSPSTGRSVIRHNANPNAWTPSKPSRRATRHGTVNRTTSRNSHSTDPTSMSFHCLCTIRMETSHGLSLSPIRQHVCVFGCAHAVCACVGVGSVRFRFVPWLLAGLVVWTSPFQTGPVPPRQPAGSRGSNNWLARYGLSRHLARWCEVGRRRLGEV